MLTMHKVEQRIIEADVSEEEHRWIVFISYNVLTYVVALRGHDGLMIELRGLRNQLEVGRQDHCMIVLFGKLKRERNNTENTKSHTSMLPSQESTSSAPFKGWYRLKKH